MKLFVGYYIHSLSLNELKFERGLILVDELGKILEVTKECDNLVVYDYIEKYNIDKADVYMLDEDQFLLPGLIDSHSHAPQIVNLGRGHNLPLLEWLNTYTFPREAVFSNFYDSCYVFCVVF